MKNKYLRAKLVSMFLGALAVLHLTNATAEPTVGPFLISNLRPYVDGNNIYITMAGQSSVCPTTVFILDMTRQNAKETYAILLAAHLGGRQVTLEIRNVVGGQWGCTGWGTHIQSVYVF